MDDRRPINDCFALPPGVDWTPVDDALAALRSSVAPVVGTEVVALKNALGRVLAADKQDDLELAAAGDTQRRPIGGTPGYITCMVHAGWQATDWLELTGGVENLTDEDYRIHGSGQNEPGLNGILAAKVTW